MLRLFILIFILFCSCNSYNNTNAGWQKVFQNDASGSATFGDKTKLIEAVRLGYPVRIGWGGMRVEHVADADFLTIFKGEEVFAQIRTIIGQAPQKNEDSLKIKFRSQNHWTKITGTNGYSISIMTNYFQDTIIGGGTDKSNATPWYILYPEHNLKIETNALWRRGSPNWKKLK